VNSAPLAQDRKINRIARPEAHHFSFEFLAVMNAFAVYGED
jgi:hypothetical protein